MSRTLLSAAALVCASGSALATESQWDFNGDLSASFGPGVAEFGPAGAANSMFGTTASFGINPIAGEVGNVMWFNAAFADGGLIMHHGAGPNAGGLYTNNYTLIYDLYVPTGSWGNWFSFYNTNGDNTNDGDAFINPTGGIGIGGVYDGMVNPDTWHRIAFTWEYDGAAMDFAKYIDGVQVGFQDNWSSVDGRWSLYNTDTADYDYFWLLSDDNGDHTDGYISSFYFTDRAMTPDEILALGGADADGIIPSPGVLGLLVLAGAVRRRR